MYLYRHSAASNTWRYFLSYTCNDVSYSFDRIMSLHVHVPELHTVELTCSRVTIADTGSGILVSPINLIVIIIISYYRSNPWGLTSYGVDLLRSHIN